LEPARLDFNHSAKFRNQTVQAASGSITVGHMCFMRPSEVGLSLLKHARRGRIRLRKAKNFTRMLPLDWCFFFMYVEKPFHDIWLARE
jgi:hypothetical protein